jgi:cell division protein FtsQ
LRGAPPIRPPSDGVRVAAERAPVERGPAPSRPARQPARPTAPAARATPARPPVPGLRPPAAPAVAAPTEPGIDPRMSARRQAVRLEEDRRRIRRALWLVGVVGVAVLVAVATRTPLLDVDQVEVAGAERITTADVDAVLAGAGLHAGDPLLEVDLGQARLALEALPGVVEADVQRRWPGTIVVDLVERTPVAAVAVAGGTALVGADGIVVAVADPASLAGLTGVVPVAGPADLAAGDRYDAAGLLAVAAAVPDVLRPLIAGIGPGEGEGAVELALVDGGVIRLGAADQLATKLVAAATVLTQVDTACLATVDVRVPSAPAVTREPGC